MEKGVLCILENLMSEEEGEGRTQNFRPLRASLHSCFLRTSCPIPASLEPCQWLPCPWTASVFQLASQTSHLQCLIWANVLQGFMPGFEPKA